MCADCHQSRALAWNEDTDGWWQHREVVCNACAELDRARAETKDPEPGARPYVVLDPEYTPDRPRRT